MFELTGGIDGMCSGLSRRFEVYAGKVHSMEGGGSQKFLWSCYRKIGIQSIPSKRQLSMNDHAHSGAITPGH